jgi:hypothetical protein
MRNKLWKTDLPLWKTAFLPVEDRLLVCGSSVEKLWA